MVTYTQDDEGFATLTLDEPGRSTPVLHTALMEVLAEALARALAAQPRGLILTSAKQEFLVGADLEMLRSLRDAGATYALCQRLHAGLRQLETCGVPVVAALNGTALGGGYELALACHHRILLDKPGVQVGLPEASLGLMPGAGGTQRLPRLIGAQAALPLLLEGKRLRPAEALRQGLVDALAPDREALLAQAKAWLQSGGRKQQPWDEKGYKLPGGAVQSPQGAQVFTAGIALLRKKTYGLYPHALHILSAVYEGLQLPLEKALAVEARYFARTLQTKEARHMLRTLWFHLNEANRGMARPADVPEQPLSQIGVLGAGMMGAGIAYVSAAQGLKVMLKDSSLENAQRGKSYSEALLKDKLEKGQLRPEASQALLDRIQPCERMEDLADCTLVIEAVYEDRALKAEVTRAAEAVLPPRAVFASNTSTLPITGLAAASQRPAQFIGLHFFSPVEKMQLVEVILGAETSPATLALAIDYVRRLRKTPIVVRDSRGFFTSRVFATYVREAFFMLDEGVAPALIEHMGRAAGMPVAPLALADEVSLELMHRIALQTQADLGPEIAPDAALALALRTGVRMVVEQGRLGKKARAGFYEYPENGRKYLWPALSTLYPLRDHGLTHATLQKRLLHIQALEAARCLAEGVLLRPQDGDLGSIFGWGFAPYSGGVLSYIDYVGLPTFIADCEGFALQFGPRFQVPELLYRWAAEGRGVYAD